MKEKTENITKRNDFVELKFTGYSNGIVFDSNIEEDLKKVHPNAKTEKMVVVIGEGFVVNGLDKELEGKEYDREYKIILEPKDAFGERKRELMKTIPLKIFHEQKVQPYAGLTLSMDGMLVKIIAVSGARVMTDFNNPMAGKKVEYKFTISRKIEDEKEKCDALFRGYLRMIPEYEIKEEIIIKGPKFYEGIVNAFNDKFKVLIGKELKFELKEKVK